MCAASLTFFVSQSFPCSTLAETLLSSAFKNCKLIRQWEVSICRISSIEILGKTCCIMLHVYTWGFMCTLEVSGSACDAILPWEQQLASQKCFSSQPRLLSHMDSCSSSAWLEVQLAAAGLGKHIRLHASQRLPLCGHNTLLQILQPNGPISHYSQGIPWQKSCERQIVLRPISQCWPSRNFESRFSHDVEVLNGCTSELESACLLGKSHWKSQI